MGSWKGLLATFGSLLAAAISVGCSTAGLEGAATGHITVLIGVPPRQLLDESRESPGNPESRGRHLAALFQRAGCSDLEVTPGYGREPQTLMCRLPGESEQTIVVSAGFLEPASRRQPDAWSGAVLLPNLYRSLSAVDRRHTYVFVAFDDVRSNRRVAQLSGSASGVLREEIRQHAVASVVVRGLNLNRAGVWKKAADTALYRDFISVSKSMEIPITLVQLAMHPLPTEVPSIFIGIVDRWIGEYLDSFRLVAAYLGYLDQTLALRREPPSAGPASPRSVAAPVSSPADPRVSPLRR
jgi:hypothetical protein